MRQKEAEAQQQAGIRDCQADVLKSSFAASERCRSRHQGCDHPSEFEKRVSANEFATFKDFTDALVEAAARSVPRPLSSGEKEIREATLNEPKRAQELGAIIPQLGSGVPTAALNADNLTATQKMAIGYKAALQRARKPGG